MKAESDQKSMRLRRGEGPPIRLLTAVPICDGHDSAINTLNLEFIRHGIEVIYLGYHRSARDIVRAAIQEDARAIGISSYNGGHLEFFAEVLARLKQQGASSIGVFGGGGGTITPDDAARMKGRGVDEIFFAGTPLPEMVEWVKRTYRSPARSRARDASPDRQLAQLLSSVEGRRLIKSQIINRQSKFWPSPASTPLSASSPEEGGGLEGGEGEIRLPSASPARAARARRR